MEESKIQLIVESAVTNLRRASEINTIIGKPIQIACGTTILPISQVTFAFVAGGGDYTSKKNKKKTFKNDSAAEQFAGGTGGGATLTPVGFLVVSGDKVKILNVRNGNSVDKLFDAAKELFENVKKS